MSAEGDDAQPTYDWSAYYDDEGRLYYYNSVTDESCWDPPEEGYNPPEEEPPTTAAAAADDDDVNDANAETHGEDGGAPGGDEDTAAAVNAEEDAAGGDAFPQPTTPPDDGDNNEFGEEEAVSDVKADNNDDGNVEIEDGADEVDAAAATCGGSGDKIVVYEDEEGREYYYNTVTGETQWDKPETGEFISAEEYEAEQEQQQDEVVDADADGTAEGQGYDNQDTAADADATIPGSAMKTDEEEVVVPEVREPTPEPEEEIDPAIKRLQDAETALNLPDSIMEPNCMKNVTEVVTGNDGNPQKAISALIESYQGQSAICGLLGRWLADMKTGTETKSSASTAAAATTAAATKIPLKSATASPVAKSTTSQSDTDGFESTANFIRGVCEDVISKTVKDYFSKEAGDSILNLSKSEAAFLEDMMDSKRWRRLLIDLSASHKTSAVLVYCLRAISRRGHHREIAKRINQSDHYPVFNAMLLSELATIGELAVSAGSDSISCVGMDELVNDLRRACSSTSYTYLYSVELLRYLAEKTRAQLKEAGPNKRMSRVLRKWEALVQDLESAMMDPSASSAVAGSTPLFRKRRLEVALTISSLQQNQRKRRRIIQPEADGGNVLYQAIGDERRESPLENALHKLLGRYAQGIQINDSILDPLLPQGLDLDTAEMAGDLLIQHPLAVRAILGYLYKPGSTRINSPVAKNKCARLVALAVLASERAALREQDESEDAENYANEEKPKPSDEVALTRTILEGSQLCEQLESMVSFLVTSGPGGSKATGNPGQKLIALALKNAVVAQGVIIWAHEFTRGGEFVLSASYPTLSVSILSLVRIVSFEQPFTRREAMEIALSFLGHANSDISYKKMNALKEQSLRLLLFLLVKGEVAPVLNAVAGALNGKGGSSSGLDASLVRYFVGGVVDIVRPPVSFAFVRALDGVLRAPKCLDAVRSSYFSEAQRKKLVTLLKSFEILKSRGGPEGKPLEGENAALITDLLAAYKVD